MITNTRIHDLCRAHWLILGFRCNVILENEEVLVPMLAKGICLFALLQLH